MRYQDANVNPLLTDLYQITMDYAYWLLGRPDEQAVFDLFFRKNPFKGEFTIFAGLGRVIDFVENFKFTLADVQFLQQKLPGCKPEFFEWLLNLNCHGLKLFALKEGSICFPRIPLIRVEGPLSIAQHVETTFLNLVNYATLEATNAARFRLAAGPDKKLLEFGLRRAHGPDGGLSASHYSYIGGFDGTSNVLAGKIYDIPIGGTHAHSYVSSFRDFRVEQSDLKDRAYYWRKKLNYQDTNTGELEAFIGYAMAFPNSFLALVDTYDTLKSGIPNFICVALALIELGHKPRGARLDSGDLAYLSKQAKKMFKEVGEICGMDLSYIAIVASNDINEETLWSLRQQHHEIDTFGIGTHLVTCQSQPALGGVYKLVEIEGKPVVKLSQEKEKATIPGRKTAYRLVKDDKYIDDFLTLAHEEPPQPGQKILCRDLREETKRAFAIPDEVIPLHNCVWSSDIAVEREEISMTRERVKEEIGKMREDHLRPVNPAPYKISVSDELFNSMHELWVQDTPIGLID